MPTSPLIIAFGAIAFPYLGYCWYTRKLNPFTASIPLFFIGTTIFLTTDTPHFSVLPIALGTTLAATHIYGVATFALPDPPLAYCHECNDPITHSNNLYFKPTTNDTEAYCPDCRIRDEITDLKQD